MTDCTTYGIYSLHVMSGNIDSSRTVLLCVRPDDESFIRLDHEYGECMLGIREKSKRVRAATIDFAVDATARRSRQREGQHEGTFHIDVSCIEKDAVHPVPSQISCCSPGYAGRS